MRRGLVRTWGLAAACCTLTLSGCLAQDHAPKPAASSPDPDISTLPRPTASHAAPAKPKASPDTDPKKAAEAWVSAFVERRYDDPKVRSYLDRIAPLSTPALLKTLRDSGSDDCNEACKEFRQSKTVITADIQGSNIPDEAPRTATQVWVDVTYEEDMQPDDDDVGGMQRGIQLVVVKVGGKWLVNKQLQR